MLLSILVALLTLGLGIVFTFWGYRFFKILLPIWGFMIGFMVGAGAVALLFGDGLLTTTSGWIVAFIAGLIFAVVSYLFYAIGILILSGAIGYGLAVYLMLALGVGSRFLTASLGIIGALIGAGLTVILDLEKWLITILMAGAGSAQIVVGLLLLFGRISLDDVGTGQTLAQVFETPFFWLFLWAVIVGLGFIVQSRDPYELELE
jgi:hypothetical protein